MSLRELTLVMLVGASTTVLAAQVVDPNTLDGKNVAGYQGWFSCPGDGTDPSIGWFHWSKDRTNPPRGGNYAMDMWPDTTGFDPDELFTVPNLLLDDGSQAALYSPRNLKTVERHFKWMRDAGIDGVFWQRFITDVTNANIKAHRNAVMQNVASAAETYGRVFAIEYDCNGAANSTLFNNLSNDWRALIDTYHITDHPRYLHQNGKPVVIVWGLGFNSIDNTPATATQIMNFLRSDPVYGGNYLIGGTPSYWRELKNDAQTDPAWTAVYESWDVIHPWTVGRYKNLTDLQTFKTNVWVPDVNRCRQLGIGYLPVVWPGFSWQNLKGTNSYVDRLSGDFLWAQIHAIQDAGAGMFFTAMFDEVNESTAILPVSTAHPPTDFWVTNNGLPPDWYMRLAGAGGEMLRGELPLTAAIPISPACDGAGVSINLGEDDSAGLTHPQVNDGDTVATTVGSKLCRKNVNSAQDYYFYFAVDDSFAFAGSLPELCVTIDYYDLGTGSLTLQYDSASSAYAGGGSVSLTNTSRWLRKVFHVTDAYFANRQNGGADFRIFGGTGRTFYLDRVLATSSVPLPPSIGLSQAAITHEIAPGQSPPDDSFTLVNAGRGILEYTLSADAPWLSVSASAGTNSGEIDHFTIHYQTEALGAGVHTATIQVNAPGADNSPAAIDVTINVASLSDFDGDRDVDQSDFAHLQLCITEGTSPPTGDCQDADLNNDTHVDGADVDLFLACLAGPGLPVPSGCAQ